MLREYQIAFVIADTVGKWPYAEELTAHEQLYLSGYGDAALKSWARRIRRWRRGRDVFVYFDNDAKVHAPFDAQQLARFLA